MRRFERDTQTRAGARRGLTYANVVASLALFVALGGGAYAAVAVPRNSVGAPQLKNRAVTPAKVAASTRRLFRGRRGARGVTGPTGPSDAFIAVGSSGDLSAGYVKVASITVPPGNYLLQAKIVIHTPATNTAAVADCTVSPTANGSVIVDKGSVTLPAYAKHQSSGVISLAAGRTFTSATTVSLACKASDGLASFEDDRIWAINTGSLHASD